MTIYYQPVEEHQFATGFKPDAFQAGKINEIVRRRASDIAHVAFDWSQEAMVSSGSPGFGIVDFTTVFKRAFKGKRGYTVGKLEDYKDPNPECKFNTRFSMLVEGDGWWTNLTIACVVEFGESYDDDGNPRRSDYLEVATILSGMNADDAGAYAKMVRWWTTVNPSKAEG